MNNYREILTKAITSKCKKKSIDILEMQCNNNPDTILGCWVINHTFSGKINNSVAILNGSYDVNVWYSYDNDTKTGVTSQNFTYTDNLNLKDKKISNDSEVIVNCLKQPNVSDVSIDKGMVKLKIEKELGLEIIGTTTVKVQVDDNTDEYEEIIDSEKDEELNINIDKLDDDFIEDKN